MILDIIKYPDKFLKNISKPVKQICPEEKKLLADMLGTMYDKKGIGMAAVQVGLLKRLVVIDIGKNNVIKIANPKIIARKGSASIAEGCLSVPNESVEIERAKEIVVKGLNDDNKEITLLLHGLEAVVMQHEIDHLEGKTIMDYKKNAK